MTEQRQVVSDQWSNYVTEHDGSPLFISFDETVTQGEPPSDLGFCARVIIPIHNPNENGGPVAPEHELLWELEHELCGLLQEKEVKCRLVGRLTYRGSREIVFQLHDWDSFRPPVGAWIGKHKEYDIEVSEHEGWDFFDDCIRPTPEDRIFMGDQGVVERLIANGSDAEKEHALEYVFVGGPGGLKRIAAELQSRGYQPLEPVDFESQQIVLVIQMPLDLWRIVDQSIANHRVAEEFGVKCDGWGALVVE